jgi:sugar/nucleoside kinase (ribokinase family)
MSTRSAVVAGHICLDIIPAFSISPGHGGSVVEPGKLLNVGPAALATGGAASNTGLALHRLGIPTRIMGKIGDDLFGRAILDIVAARDPALTAGMIISDSPSSYTVVISPPGADRSFLHCTGANDTFGPEDVDPAKLAGADLFHFGYPPLMRRMHIDGGHELAALFRSVKQAGLATSLDLAHVDVDAPAGKVDWRRLLTMVMPYVDFFLPSLDEALFTLDRDDFAEVVRRTGDRSLAAAAGIERLAAAADAIIGMGAAVVGLKLGDQGMYLRTTADAARLARVGPLALNAAWCGRELLAPTFRVDVVGTTGAGDCAIAGFFAALLRGQDPAAALTSAVAAGASNVEVADAISGIPTWVDLHARIDRGWPRRGLDLELPDWQWQATPGVWRGLNDRSPALA